MLARLSEIDSSVEEAWFCHPSVVHVYKYKHEGGFCGYRNTQMTISYIRGSKATGHQLFPERIPTVIEMQDWIEKAWDEGINDYARKQVGRLRGTRKWIGTTEVRTQPEFYVEYWLICRLLRSSNIWASRATSGNAMIRWRTTNQTESVYMRTKFSSIKSKLTSRTAMKSLTKFAEHTRRRFTCNTELTLSLSSAWSGELMEAGISSSSTQCTTRLKACSVFLIEEYRPRPRRIASFTM